MEFNPLNLMMNFNPLPSQPGPQTAGTDDGALPPPAADAADIDLQNLLSTVFSGSLDINLDDVSEEV